MASGKRLTRKDLRQPDLFQRATRTAFEAYESHRHMVWLTVAAFVVVLIGIVGFRMFKEQQEARAAQAFAVAMDLYQIGSYQEAIPAFEEVQSYRWSRYANVAYLYRANAYLALSDLANAANAAQRFVIGTRDNSLMRQIGLFTLGSIAERRDQCKEALQHYTEAQRITGAFRELAVLGKARCSEQLGDLPAAIAAYREYLKLQPGSPVALQVAELESKLTAQTVEK